MWRSWDRPLVGTIYRLPDIKALQRGVTFTILPDGRSMRVPAMNRLEVRAQNEAHTNDESSDIMQALQNIIKGRKPQPGEARHDGMGVAHGARHHIEPHRAGREAGARGYAVAAGAGV